VVGLAGWDDRADARGKTPRAGALAGVDAVQHGRTLGRATGAEQLPNLPAPKLHVSARAFIEYASRLFIKVGSRGMPQDIDGVRQIAALSYDRELDRTGVGRQLAAIIRLRRPHRGSCGASPRQRS